MENQRLHDLLAKLEIRGGTLRTSTDTDLDSFEISTGFRLPRSYRAYCKIVGAGCLVRPTNYHIRAPGITIGNSEYWDLGAHNQELRSYFIRDSVRNKDQFDRSWFFAQDIGRAEYFWDPVETTCDGAECAVFMMSDGYAVYRLAETFQEFIDLCVTKAPPPYEQDVELDLIFEPAF